MRISWRSQFATLFALRFALRFALPFALLFAGLSASAENPCTASQGPGFELQLAQSDSGIAGTGRAGGDESGLGGTGLHASNANSATPATDESGIGGTGYTGGDGDDDESGIGGTGVFGTITSFGSICVNGLRIHYDDATPVTIDGRASTSGVLAVGHVVAIDAIHQPDAAQGGGELSAASVAVLSALTGPITHLDYEAKRLSIMGQPVVAPDDFSLEVYGLALGARARVSGLRRGDGVVVANRIAQLEVDRRDSVSGIAHWVEPGLLEVGGIRIPIESLDDETYAETSAVEDGQFVQAFGAFRAEDSILELSELTKIALFDRRAERLSVEGYVQRLAGDERLWLPGVELDRRSLERVVDRPKLAGRLWITGHWDGRGRLRVERVRSVVRPTSGRDFDRPRPPKPPIRNHQVEQSKERPPRPQRPNVDRPPRIERPEKIDRPTKLDRALRDTLRVN